MGTRFRTFVDSLSIIDGVWQDQPSNIGVFEHSSIIPSRRGRGSLYILVETVGGFPDHSQVQQHVIEAAQEYFHTDGSITAGLREAIKAVNAALFELNLNAPREERGVAGVTCMVLKDQDAYIGQAGPAVLYHVARDKFQRLPQESTWLSSEKLEDVDISKNPPLGLRREIEPELSHLYMRDGDVFILASTSLVKLASDEEVRSAVIHRGAHAVRENLEAIIAGEDASALIVEVRGIEEEPTPAEKADIRAGVEKRPGVWARVSSALRGLFLSAPEEREEFEAEEEFEEEEAEEMSPVRGIDLRGTIGSAWRSVSGFFRRLIPVLARVLPEAGPGQRRRQQLRKGRPVGGVARRQAVAAHEDKRWIWIALAIPVLLVLLFVITRFQYQRSRQAHLNQLRQAAEKAKASAEASPAIADQRAKLREALAFLDEALRLKPGDQELTSARQAIQDLLDDKNYVSRLYYFGELKEFPETQDVKSQLSTVVVHGIDVYVLDVGMDRVYKYLLNSTKDSLQDLTGEPVLVRKGDTRDGIVVDELLDIAWVESQPGAAGGNLLILDKKGHLLRYDPLVGLKLLPVADSAAWREPVATATFYTNWYLLDPPANVLLKYEPTSAGYDAPPSNYFKAEANANVSNGVDVSIDGNIYVLHSDGQITKYFQGTSAPFPQTNLDEPLKAPFCLFASGLPDQEGYVYVADTGNQRIVKFSRDGEFLRQYRSRDPEYMNAIKGIFVEEAEKKLYLVNGNKLYWVKLPD